MWCIARICAAMWIVGVLFLANRRALAEDDHSAEELDGRTHAGVTFDDEQWDDEEYDDDGLQDDLPLSRSDDGETAWSPERIGDHNPLCPPAIHAVNRSTCMVTRCEWDGECNTRERQACCYNGCVFTCMKLMDPPLAFDWLEETQNHLTGNHSQKLLSARPLSPDSAAGSRPEETILVNGGCHLTYNQFVKLESFKQNENVKSCYCETGDVYCKVV